ncbi:uncharacterized protein KQ657_000005 [Scheffersomyces spartinae]|uniref:Nucleoporin Nup159/Nup146 N-terminal domain-containing protein n=1 Tax=Scheffersomyces spartinae TaxID=45513 RepID=A0A9P7VDU6_9ASCO|nr:uncharacterized protein KQ657_000005 [Scheffersomyces spartinae]KAG7195999.1 hypothetical protein KQ657_000005 [Scheffersomyces spartinae]
MSVLEEQISDTVGFKLCTKEEGIAVFSQAIELDPVRDKQLSLLAVGNLTGKIALSNVTSIKIGKTSQFHPKEQEEDVDELDIGSLKVVHGSGKIREVKFNATEKRLWVLEDDKLAYISLKNDLEETKLELEYTRFTEISSILPHPIISGHLAFVTNDNVLHVLPNCEEGNSIEVLQDVRCFAWAMDGKSLVAMKNSNEIYVFNVDGEKKNALTVDTSVASDLDLNVDTLVPCSIQSLSNDKWLVVYDGEDASPDDHHIASFVVTTSGEPETTTTTTTTIAAEILLPGFDSQRCTSYYSQSLPNWSQNYPSLALATSSLATEIVVLNMGIKALFITPDEDLYRTIFPMNDTTEEDTNALGFAVDLTGTHLKVIQPWAGLDEAVGVLPIAWVLLDTGRLSGWYLVDKQGIQNLQLSLLGTLGSHEKEVISGDLESENSDVELGRKNSNPFASSASEANPFAPSKTSPFGTISTEGNPFASGFGKTSALDSLKDASASSAITHQDSEKKPSPFDTMKKDLIIETLEVSTKESSPVDEPGSTISTNSPSNNQNANSNGSTPYAVPVDAALEVGVESGNESLIGIEVVPTGSSMNFLKKEADSLEDGHNSKSMGSPGNPKGFITKNQFTMRNSSQNLSSFSVSLVKSGDFENTHPNIQIELLAGASDKKEGYIESLDESEISAEEPPEETESSSVTDSVQEPFEVLGEPTLDVEEDSDGSIEETSEFEKIRFSGPRPPVSYSRYDGPTKELPRSNNEIYDMMVQIYNHTEGQLKVLHMNTRSFEKFVKSNEQKDYSDNFSKDLASWRLAWCEMFQEILIDFSSEVYDLATILKAQLTKSEKVKKNANELRKGVEEIQKMLAFIAKFQAEKNEEVLKKMELDLGSQKLQRSLRTKLSNVEQQYEKLIALMMPLKTRFSDPQNMIFNINKAILRLQSNVVKCEGRFLNLERLNSSTSKATQKLVDYTPLTQESKADDSRLSQWDYGLVEVCQKPALFE